MQFDEHMCDISTVLTVTARRVASHPADEKSSLKRVWSGSGDPFQNFTPGVKSLQRLMLETSNFVHGSAM